MSDLIDDALEHVQEKIAGYRKETLVYYFDKEEEPVTFNKYTIDTVGIIKHKESRETPSYGNEEYNRAVVTDNTGKRRSIYVGRAVASTFLGAPSTPAHTADHIISEQKKNDSLENVRWLDKKGQGNNRDVPETYKSAIIIVKDGVEKTVKEWVAHMNASKAQEHREYTVSIINSYVAKKQHGFSFKEYPDLPGEDWKPVKVPGDKRGPGDGNDERARRILEDIQYETREIRIETRGKCGRG
ncbi:hypothetical protein PBCVNEJV1_791R [Paramecium bursaria Chlorella virus NE-JV-1]|nr:hypothetical protein PBCVNEJV1_791R [Paramecium bursaria Chlorella virus NE-JV-1]